jgi:hypothetical protein
LLKVGVEEAPMKSLLHRVASSLSTILLVGCGSTSEPTAIGVVQQPIYGGTADVTHDAVVEIISYLPSDLNTMFNCTGTVINVQNGIGYVLTAAHCCNNPVPPALIVAAPDFVPYVADVGFAHPKAPAYAVVPSSIASDPQYDNSTGSHDFCLLQFWGAPATMPTIKLAAGVPAGTVPMEFVGYGTTKTDNQNTKRFSITMPASASSANAIEYDMTGGRGPCAGDSGGPALVPAGAPQSQQSLVAVTSNGDAACTQGGMSSLVSSALHGFIANYFATTPPAPPEPGSACDKCSDRELSVGGVCEQARSACDNDADCQSYTACAAACATGDRKCESTCRSAHSKGAAVYDQGASCICASACVKECGGTCPLADPAKGAVPGAPGTPTVAGGYAAPAVRGRPVTANCAIGSGANRTSMAPALFGVLLFLGARRKRA